MDIKPIAHIHNDFKEKFGIPRQSGLSDNVSTIIFEKEFRDINALRGIEGFSHLWLIWGFSEVRGIAEGEAFRPTVRPPRLGGNERVGVFASRSPFRPNPLGLSSVSLLSVSEGASGPTLVVSGADLMDGTPIYDIKPYLKQFDSHSDARSGYVEEKEFRTVKVSFPPSLLEKVPQEKRLPLVQALEQDPRPHYQEDGGRVYGMAFADLDVRFKVQDGTLFVVDVL